jgi:hypothetical protein
MDGPRRNGARVIGVRVIISRGALVFDNNKQDCAPAWWIDFPPTTTTNNDGYRKPGAAAAAQHELVVLSLSFWELANAIMGRKKKKREYAVQQLMDAKSSGFHERDEISDSLAVGIAPSYAFLTSTIQGWRNETCDTRSDVRAVPFGRNTRTTERRSSLKRSPSTGSFFCYTIKQRNGGEEWSSGREECENH